MVVGALCVPMRRIGFLILAESADARPANCEAIYDFAASKSQIEFGEAMIMETNGLIRRPGRKLYAPAYGKTFGLFPCGHPAGTSSRGSAQPTDYITAPICQGTNSRSP